MNFLKLLGKGLAVCSSLLILLLIIATILLHSGKSLINRDNLSDYIKSAEIMNMDVNLIFNLEESGITLEEKIYNLGIDSNIPQEIVDDILKSEEINFILGDFFSKTIDYLVNGENKPQLSLDAVNKMIDIANESLDNHINIMLEKEELKEYVFNYCNKLIEIVPDSQQMFGNLPISSIRSFLNFKSIYLYIAIAFLFLVMVVGTWSIYKPLKYFSIAMIISGVLFVLLGSMNSLISNLIISNIESMKALAAPFITILLTIWFKIGVLVSFSGVFLLIIYVVVNRIIINNFKIR